MSRAQSDAKMLLFAPGPTRQIMPWSGMSDKDAKKVQIVASPGEATAFQVAIRPFADVGQTTLSITDLAGPDGASIASKQVGIYYKKYISDGESIHPWCLRDRPTVNLESGLTMGFWLRLRVPADAKPGTYTATITATAADGEKRSIPVSVNVMPFTLAGNVPVGFGLYYDTPDGGQFVEYNAFKDESANRDRLLKEQLEIMRDFGLTSVQCPAPQVTRLRGSGAIETFESLEKVVKLAKQAGMVSNDKQAFVLSTLGMARSIGRLLGGHDAPGEELKLAGFNTAYVSAVRQLVEWGKENDAPIIQWVVERAARASQSMEPQPGRHDRPVRPHAAGARRDRDGHADGRCQQRR